MKQTLIKQEISDFEVANRVEEKLKLEKLPEGFQSNKDFLSLYGSSDMLYEEFITRLTELGAIRRDQIPIATARTWFIELLRRGFQRKDFIEAFERAKNCKIYGGIDFLNFIEGEPLYTKPELVRFCNLEIQRRIAEAKKNIELGRADLTEEQLTAIEIQSTLELEEEVRRERKKKIEAELKKVKEKRREQFKIKKHQVMGMSFEEQTRLRDLAVDRGELKPSTPEESTIMLQYIVEFSTEISQDTITDVLKERHEV